LNIFHYFEAEVRTDEMMGGRPGRYLFSEIFGARKTMNRLTGPLFFGLTNSTGPKLGALGGTPNTSELTVFTFVSSSLSRDNSAFLE
jgi:hypothetical protein